MASSSRSSVVFFPPTASALHQKRRKAKKHALRVPRPKNCFMLYRTHVMPMIMVELGNINNRIISQIAAERWNAESEPVKIWYRLMAKMGKEEHAINHPGYKYAPNKKILDYPAISYRGDDEDHEQPKEACDMVSSNGHQDVISDDDDNYDDPTYGRKKSRKKYTSARRGLGRRQQHDLQTSNSSRPQSTWTRQKAAEYKHIEDHGTSQMSENPDVGSSQSTTDVATFLGPQALSGLSGGMYNEVQYHVSCDHGSTCLSGSFNPIADHQILVESQRLYPLQTQCCGVFQQHPFQPLEPQPSYPLHDIPFHLMNNYRHFSTLAREERDIYPRHQEKYHEGHQNWTPPFYTHSPGRHSLYDLDPEANTSVETLVDPNGHWLVHQYYDPCMINDSKLRTEKDLSPLPMGFNLETEHDPHAVLAQLSSTIYRLDQVGDESLYTEVGQEDRTIKANSDKTPVQARRTTGQRFLINPTSPTYMSFAEAGQM